MVTSASLACPFLPFFHNTHRKGEEEQIRIGWWMETLAVSQLIIDTSTHLNNTNIYGTLVLTPSLLRARPGLRYNTPYPRLHNSNF